MKKYNIRGSSLIIWDSIFDIFYEHQPRLTVRQIFYALSVRNVVPKAEKGYRQTCYHLKRMREDQVIPYNWIAAGYSFDVSELRTIHCNWSTADEEHRATTNPKKLFWPVRLGAYDDPCVGVTR